MSSPWTCALEPTRRWRVSFRSLAPLGLTTPYVFANRTSTRMKVLVHDGIGIWLAARRLHQGRFAWPGGGCGAPQSLTHEQFDALVLGLPWQRMGAAGIIGLT